LQFGRMILSKDSSEMPSQLLIVAVSMPVDDGLEGNCDDLSTRSFDLGRSNAINRLSAQVGNLLKASPGGWGGCLRRAGIGEPA